MGQSQLDFPSAKTTFQFFLGYVCAVKTWPRNGEHNEGRKANTLATAPPRMEVGTDECRSGFRYKKRCGKPWVNGIQNSKTRAEKGLYLYIKVYSNKCQPLPYMRKKMRGYRVRPCST